MNLTKDCGLPAFGMRDTDIAEWHVASTYRIVTEEEGVVSSGKLVLAYKTARFDTRQLYSPNTNRSDDREAYMTLLCENY